MAKASLEHIRKRQRCIDEIRAVGKHIQDEIDRKSKEIDILKTERMIFDVQISRMEKGIARLKRQK